MKLERIGGISMSYFCVQIRWQIDDVDSSEGTFFRTNTTPCLFNLNLDGLIPILKVSLDV